jgi:hypothetical protein
MWGSHLIQLKFSLYIVDFAQELSIEVAHPSGTRQVVRANDYTSFRSLIDTLRSQPDRHIRVTGGPSPAIFVLSLCLIILCCSL